MNTTMENSAAREAAGNKASRARHTPGGVGLGKDAGPEAQRVAAAIDKLAELQHLGDIALRGLSRPIAVLNVSRLVSSQ